MIDPEHAWRQGFRAGWWRRDQLSRSAATLQRREQLEDADLPRGFRRERKALTIDGHGLPQEVAQRIIDAWMAGPIEEVDGNGTDKREAS